MAEKPGGDKGRRALLSREALPKIEIPRPADRERREFRLPEAIKTPIPEQGEAPPPSARRRRNSTARFRDRTLGWFKEGDDMEVGDATVAPPPSSSRLPWIIGGVAVVAAAVVFGWML